MVEQVQSRVIKEIEEFKREMLSKSKEDILDKAYKISIVQDFEYLSFNEMDDEQIETLMEQESIIGFLWDEWVYSSGFNTFEVLDRFFKYVIEERI